MNLWQMLLARRGLMDVAEAHERGGAGGVAADNEQSTQDPDKQGEQKEQPKGDDDAAYRYTKPDRTVRKSQPVYMEDTPEPGALVDAEVVPAGEDRD